MRLEGREVRRQERRNRIPAIKPDASSLFCLLALLAGCASNCDHHEDPVDAGPVDPIPALYDELWERCIETSAACGEWLEANAALPFGGSDDGRRQRAALRVERALMNKWGIMARLRELGESEEDIYRELE